MIMPWLIAGGNVVILVYLVWRVWRLEDSHRQIGRLRSAIEQEALWRTSADDQRTPWSAHSALSTQVTHLARALGYEWKRTDAKEGWERKPDPYAIDWAAAVAPFRAYNEKCYADELWDSWGKNRRKADRRKPPILVDKPNKKRRATH